MAGSLCIFCSKSDSILDIPNLIEIRNSNLPVDFLKPRKCILITINRTQSSEIPSHRKQDTNTNTASEAFRYPCQIYGRYFSSSGLWEGRKTSFRRTEAWVCQGCWFNGCPSGRCATMFWVVQVVFGKPSERVDVFSISSICRIISDNGKISWHDISRLHSNSRCLSGISRSIIDVMYEFQEKRVSEIKSGTWFQNQAGKTLPIYTSLEQRRGKSAEQVKTLPP